LRPVWMRVVLSILQNIRRYTCCIHRYFWLMRQELLIGSVCSARPLNLNLTATLLRYLIIESLRDPVEVWCLHLLELAQVVLYLRPFAFESRLLFLCFLLCIGLLTISEVEFGNSGL
jgi:hypothetical protein